MHLWRFRERWFGVGKHSVAPKEFALVPGEPTHSVHVTWRGVDTVPSADGRRVPLVRYAVDGAVWGREAVWLEPDGRFAALRTSAPFLPFEGVREDLAGALPTLQRSALHDRLEDLKRWQQELRPVAEGRWALVGARVVDGTGAPPIDDGTVVIDGDRIVSVGASSAVSVPDGFRSVDARGTTVVPGLWEIHPHVSQISGHPPTWRQV